MKFLAYIRKPFLYSFAIGLGLGCASVVLAAWSGPLSPPPTCTSGNPGCDAPLNVSGSTQDKGSIIFAGTAGNITAVGLSATSVILSPEFCIGSSCITAWPSGGGSSQWTTSGSNIYYNGGNVGIGTASPSYPLTVNGNANINGLLLGNNSLIGSTGSAYLRFDGSNLVLDAASGGSLYLGYDQGNNIYFGASGNKMVLTSSGNVGIDTTNPAVALEVNGDIQADGGPNSSWVGAVTAPNGGGGAEGILAGQVNNAYWTGVAGQATAGNGIGVYGNATNSSGYGGYFTNSGGGVGVDASSFAQNGTGAYFFGGSFDKNISTGGCTYANAVTGGCSCPSGYATEIFAEFYNTADAFTHGLYYCILT
jgi:hypothetical protein